MFPTAARITNLSLNIPNWVATNTNSKDRPMSVRSNIVFFSVLALGVSQCQAQEKVGGAAPAPIIQASEALKDPSSYAVGFNIGSELAQSGFSDKEIETKELFLGILDALGKREPKLTQVQFQEAMTSLQQRMQKKMIEIAKANLEKANAYLEANKKKDGVQTTRTGLQYVVLKSGIGKSPTLTDTAVGHFEAKLIDGTVFQSSIKKNQPATLPVSQFLYPGCSEALQRMKVGDKWLLTLPPNLAFGENGSPPIVGPNEAIIVELELLEIKK
jgi:FKBP-type peptidyl-prolyl cis-trans isomerase FklB